jgi:hypothetical protein
LKGVQIQDLIADILRPVLGDMERELLQKRLGELGSAKRKPKGSEP